MRAWGSRSFENEAACDWAEELVEHGLPLVTATLDKALIVKANYLTVYDVAVAIAACEVIARLMGGDFLPCPDRVKVVGWVSLCSQTIPFGTEQKSIDVIDHILSRPTGSFALWQTEYIKNCWYANVWNIRREIYSIMPAP
jgi:hypothetical protein